MSNDKTYDRHINIWINGKEVVNNISSIKKEMFNLTNELGRTTRGTKEYNDKVAELKKVRGILKEHTDSLRETKGSWDTLKEGVSGFMGKIAGFTGAVVGAYEGIKGVIFSSEGLSDKFNAILAGGKEAFWQFQSSIANLDFSNFFKNLKEAWNRGKDLEEQLDRLADAKAFSDYQLSALNKESRALQETTKNVGLDINVRKAAGEKRKEIEQQIYDRTVLLANRTFKIEKDTWEGRNKMAAEEAVKMYGIIDSLSEDQLKNLDSAFKAATENQLGSVKQGIQSVLFGQSGQELVKGIPPEVLKTYADYYSLVEKGEKDVIPKLFNAFKSLESTTADAQERLNASVKEESILAVKDANAAQASADKKHDLDVKADKEQQDFLDAKIVRMNKEADARRKYDVEADKEQQDFLDKELKQIKEKEDAKMEYYAWAEKENQDFIDAIIKQMDDEAAEKKKVEEETAALKLKLAKGVIDLGATLYDRQLAKLDAQYKKDIAAAGDNAEAKKKIDLEYNEHKIKIQRKAAIAEKTSALFSIVIDTAKGIANAASKVITLPEIPWIIANGIIQAAIVAVQPLPQFSKGGYTPAGGKYEPTGIVHAGEWVAPAWQVLSPQTGPMIKALEYARVNGFPGYSDGGSPGMNSRGSGAAGSPSPLISSDPEMKAQLGRLSAILDRLERNGVKNNWPWNDVNNMRKGMDKLKDHEDSLTM
jgi:hypothetical protein